MMQLDKVSIGSDLSYTYNPTAKRFAAKSSGRFLSANQAGAIVDNAIERNSNNLQDLASKLASGKIDLSVFVIDGSQAIKDLHILNAVKSVGNRADVIKPTQIKELNRRVKEQLSGGVDKITGDRYGFKELIKDLARGEVSEAQLKNRLRMFTDSATLTQQHIKKVGLDKSYSQGLRILGANHNHCAECLSYAGLSWQPIAKLIMPGEACSCRSQCKCSVQYK